MSETIVRSVAVEYKNSSKQKALRFWYTSGMEPIAHREVVIVDRNSNQERRIAFEIMPPHIMDDGEDYICQAKITGDIHKSFDMGGVDSLQALMLAIQCLDLQYEKMKKEQYDFFWPDKTNPMKSFDLVKEDLKRFYEM